jgi:catechol 2,3-dioxygenase-like lactoylglutathione lyase family enzyme
VPAPLRAALGWSLDGLFVRLTTPAVYERLTTVYALALTAVDIAYRLNIDRRESIGSGPMSRVQLALNVADLDEAVDFYSKLFATEPAKVRPGYANFAVANPPLKLVLIEDDKVAAGSLNHLGVEVETPEEVAAAEARLSRAELATTTEDHVACCYAVQDKVWVGGPGGELWEIYTVLADAEMPPGELRPAEPSDAACCADRPDLAATGPGCC